MLKLVLIVFLLLESFALGTSAKPDNVTEINFYNGQEVEEFIAKDDSPIKFIIFFKYSNRDELSKRTLEASGREKSKAGKYFTLKEVKKLIALEEKDRKTLNDMIDQLQAKILASNDI
eukprot:Awhi_evm1s13950